MIEVLKQSLDLIVKSKRYAEECSHIATQSDCDHFDAVAENLRKAIQEEALRNVQRIGQEIEQEPIANLEIVDLGDGNKHFDNHWLSDLHSLPCGDYLLYTHPPQRKPLTDEQVEKIIKANMSFQMNLAGIRQDFEAAHDIKE
jgi:hypothetical protein